jgi:UDP-N-acetylmuramate--alanine ligase
VAGTHGKTTTTSMIAALLDAGGVDPTVINGGIINAYGSNARLGASEWMVVEADESDGSFLRLDGTIAVVTNIDPEHLDHYGDFDSVKDAFVEFVENVPFYGAAMLCLDHPEVQAILPRVQDRRIVTYGFSAQADVRGEHVQPIPGGNRFDVQCARSAMAVGAADRGDRAADAGRHNVQNALAAIGVALIWASPTRRSAPALPSSAGSSGASPRWARSRCRAACHRDRRLRPSSGRDRAVLAAAREGAQGRVIAVVQPHRFTRLRDLMDEFQQAFNDADIVYAAPVYPAGEQPIEGVDSAALVAGLKRAGHRAARKSGARRRLPLLAADLKADDMVVCLGAGDITKWAAGLRPRCRANWRRRRHECSRAPKTRRHDAAHRAGQAHRRCAARAAGVVQVRRQCGMAVRARGCRGFAGFP